MKFVVPVSVFLSLISIASAMEVPRTR